MVQTELQFLRKLIQDRKKKLDDRGYRTLLLLLACFCLSIFIPSLRAVGWVLLGVGLTRLWLYTLFVSEIDELEDRAEELESNANVGYPRPENPRDWKGVQ